MTTWIRRKDLTEPWHLEGHTTNAGVRLAACGTSMDSSLHEVELTTEKPAWRCPPCAGLYNLEISQRIGIPGSDIA